MTKLKIYWWEIVQRWPLWYVFFISVIVFLIAYSFFQGSLWGWISVTFLFLVIAVWYVIRYLISLKKTELVVQDNHLIIDKEIYPFDKIIGFNIELDKDYKPINFVLSTLDSNLPLKWTICDDFENVKKVVNELLSKWVSLYDWYENDRLYKIVKFLKL